MNLPVDNGNPQYRDSQILVGMIAAPACVHAMQLPVIKISNENNQRLKLLFILTSPSVFIR